MINLQRKYRLEQELNFTSDINKKKRLIAQLDKIDNLIYDSNDISKAGQRITTVLNFGDFSRYGLYAIHSRFGSPVWMLQDAETIDDLGYPSIIGQFSGYIEAMERINKITN
jgi:hypothetical protein